MTARPEAARYLIERGAPVGVYDDSGTPCLSLMIEKMPNIAIEAVEQFHNIDRAFRKHYFYLNYLENDSKYLKELEPTSKREKREKKEKEKEKKRMMKEKGIKKPKKEKTFAKVPIEVYVAFLRIFILQIIFRVVIVIMVLNLKAFEASLPSFYANKRVYRSTARPCSATFDDFTN